MRHALAIALLLASFATAGAQPAEWTLARVEQTTRDASAAFERGDFDEGQGLTYLAMTGCVALDLPGDHPAVTALTTLYVQRMTPIEVRMWSEDRFYIARMLYDRAPSDGDLRLFFLRSAWGLYGGPGRSHTASSLACDLADLLMRRGRLAEAKEVVATALKSDFVQWRGRDVPVHPQHWALRLLDGEIRMRERDPQARALLATLYEDMSAYPYVGERQLPFWKHRALTALTRIDAGTCSLASLQIELRALLASERELGEALLEQTDERRFRTVLIELDEEEDLFAPVVQCGIQDQAILRTTVERLLLRREMWRYRTHLVQAARFIAEGGPLPRNLVAQHEIQASGELIPTVPPRPLGEVSESDTSAPARTGPAEDPGDAAAKALARILPPQPTPPAADAARQKLRDDVQSLVFLRNLRAQLRLRRADAALQHELRTLNLFDDAVRPEGMTEEEATVIELDLEIERLETVLSVSCEEEIARRWQIDQMWPRLLRAIGGDGALIGYIPAKTPASRRLVTFVVDGNGAVSWADCGEEEAISRHLDGTWIHIVARSPRTAAALRRVGETLFDPIAARLTGKRRLLLLGTSFVRFIPWTAITDGTGAPVGERFAVSWMQSIDDLQAVPVVTSGSGALLVAPGYETTDADRHVLAPSQRVVPAQFRTTPGMQPELAAVRSVLARRGIPARTLTGSDASEGWLRLQPGRPAILHIAAHGYRVPSEVPLLFEGTSAWSKPLPGWPRRAVDARENDFIRIGLALAGANRSGTMREYDGLLSASEASTLDLRGTTLVVLSACATAAPQATDIGGAYDLSLAFRIAGADAVIGSLWPVDDAATRLLMAAFYDRIAAGDTIAAALWHAKRVVRAVPGFAQPYFWAGFEIFGNGDAAFGQAGGAKRKPGR